MGGLDLPGGTVTDADTMFMSMFIRRSSARQRTHEDFEQLLSTSGLSSLRLLQTESVVSIIESAPA